LATPRGHRLRPTPLHKPTIRRPEPLGPRSAPRRSRPVALIRQGGCGLASGLRDQGQRGPTRHQLLFGLRQRSRWLDMPTQRAAWRKLAMLDVAEILADLRVPPGNRLEKLSGDRGGPVEHAHQPDPPPGRAARHHRSHPQHGPALHHSWTHITTIYRGRGQPPARDREAIRKLDSTRSDAR
jgi:hypothetical protein